MENTIIPKRKKLKNNENFIQSRESYEDLILARKLLRLFNRAKTANVPFSITFDQIRVLNKVEFCQYGLQRGVSIKLTNKPERDNTRTFDRMKPEKGYVFDNIIVCSAKINQGKGNLSYDELMAIAQTLRKSKEYEHDH